MVGVESNLKKFSMRRLFWKDYRPMNTEKTNFKIQTINAFISVDPETGDEGVLGFLSNDGTWIPMIVADEKRLELMLSKVMEICSDSGRPVTQIRLSHREDVDTIFPNAQSVLEYLNITQH